MKRIALAFLLSLMAMSLITAVAAKGEDEPVPLSAGCNAVVWTGPDNTDVQIIVDSIKLPQALIAAWKFVPATGHWLGFAPFVSSGANDLFSVDKLDVVFLCVNGVTWWYRPVLDDSTPP
jgi:hypothetical protein